MYHVWTVAAHVGIICSAYGLYLFEYRLMYQGIHYNVTSTIYIQSQICFQPTRTYRLINRGTTEPFIVQNNLLLNID